ncbi:hypothetical protein SAMN05421820_101240 [Pedobacter steynii]|uniref:Uncharacterized protein n=1 Tax=Pedobacter steynii TaxID=430522 RepID=A0A1G9JEK5_9SPHI|nr:hypothetical protein [Pedobacter steynii]NQX38228.1 hypothetical protein [Pedobacter steynii]SDL36009.1 hypothetical protein SAMN05421820_101240 [Pedobacter steynii]
MTITIFDLINDEELRLVNATEASEKSTCINNIIQLKLHSSIPRLQNDIYVDVKKYIYFYIQSLKEKQYNYDEFSESHIVDLIQLFNVEQQFNLLEYALREIKREHLFEKTIEFENLLNKVEFKKECQNFKFRNFFKLFFTGCLYNNWSIAIALITCFMLCFIIYLPAPKDFPVLFKTTYYQVSDSFFLNHCSNILMSIFDIQQDKFVLPVNIWGTLVLILTKCFFIAIVVNVFVDQLKSRFKI